MLIEYASKNTAKYTHAPFNYQLFNQLHFHKAYRLKFDRIKTQKSTINPCSYSSKE